MDREHEAPRRGDEPPDLKSVALAMARVPVDLAPVLGVVDGRRRAFICLYLWGDGSTRLNATASARAVGYAAPHVRGHLLRRNRAIGAIIDTIIESRLGDAPGRRRAS